MPKIHPLPLDESARHQLQDLVQQPGWNRVRGEAAPSFLPAKLRARTAEWDVISDHSSTGGRVVMINLHRVDFNHRSFDQQPLIAIIHSSGSSSVAEFIDHGDWAGRTTPLPSDYLQADEATSSGVAGYYRGNPLGDSTGGQVETMPGSMRTAMERALELAFAGRFRMAGSSSPGA